VILAAKILAGRRIRIRIDGSTLMFPGRAPHHHPARP
jgi:hypothetical protein